MHCVSNHAKWVINIDDRLTTETGKEFVFTKFHLRAWRDNEIMPPILAGIDHDSKARERTLRILSLFQEKDCCMSQSLEK